MNIYIFECNNDTIGECFEKSLLGGKSPFLLKVKKGDLCFLFNYWGNPPNIYGVFEASCDAKKNIDPNAWSGKYPNQVRVKLASYERISVPRFNLEKYIKDPETGRVRNIIYGNSAQEFLQYFASGYTKKVETGREISGIEDDYRRRFPREFHCTDEHEVRSLSEQCIDNWFSTNKVYHEYERLTNIPENLIPDFTLYDKNGKPVFVEFWGMTDDPLYEKRRQKKCEIYAKYQYSLIELYPSDLKNLDYVLKNKLKDNNISFGSSLA